MTRVFLVERRIPGLDLEQMTAIQRSLLLAARSSGVRYLRSTWLPSEERCLCVFEGGGRDDVRRVNDMAQTPFARIVSAIDMQAARATSIHASPRGRTDTSR